MKSTGRISLRTAVVLGLSGVGLTACTLLARPAGLAWLTAGSFDSNGERIYFTASSESGTRIRSEGGAFPGGMMMGGTQTCASCHGADGRGGGHFLHMQWMETPDIRWSALASGEHGDGAGHAGEVEEQAYDEEAFRRAVRDGVTPGGAILSWDMPRWEIGDEDVRDLIDYLESLP